MAHRDCILCDERDGSFSIIGVHKRPSPDNKSIVVSVQASVPGPGPTHGTIEKPKSKNIPESNVQLLTPQADENLQDKTQVLNLKSNAGPKEKAFNLPSAIYNNKIPQTCADVNWRYFLDILCDCSSKAGAEFEARDLQLINLILADKRTLALFDLQKQRDIVQREGTTLSLDTFDRVRACLIQATGRESVFPCFECLRKHGPFVGCILDVCPGDPLWVKPCGNCVYLGIPCGTSSRPTQSDDKAGPKQHSPALTQRPNQIPPVPDTRSTNNAEPPKQHSPAPSQGPHIIPAGLDTRSTNTTSQKEARNDPPQATHGFPTRSPPELRDAEVPQTLPVIASNPVPRTMTPVATGPQPPTVPFDNSFTHLPDNVTSPQGELFETEPWEEAPGRIRSSACGVSNSKSQGEVIRSPPIHMEILTHYFYNRHCFLPFLS